MHKQSVVVVCDKGYFAMTNSFDDSVTRTAKTGLRQFCYPNGEDRISPIIYCQNTWDPPTCLFCEKIFGENRVDIFVQGSWNEKAWFIKEYGSSIFDFL